MTTENENNVQNLKVSSEAEEEAKGLLVLTSPTSPQVDATLVPSWCPLVPLLCTCSHPTHCTKGGGAGVQEAGQCLRGTGSFPCLQITGDTTEEQLIFRNKRLNSGNVCSFILK